MIIRQLSVLILCFGLSISLFADEDIDGKILFRNNCKACHNLDMRLVGPALEGVTERKDMDWLLKFVKSSTAMIQSGDTYADSLFKEYNQVLMPDQTLSDEEILAIFDYIKVESNKEAEVSPIPRPEVVKSNMVPLSFTDFRWWIIYTVSLLLLIIGLYKLVDIDDLIRTKAKDIPI